LYDRSIIVELFKASPPKQYTAESNNNREWLLASFHNLEKKLYGNKGAFATLLIKPENEKYLELGI
jgi:hypothetical protein